MRLLFIGENEIDRSEQGLLRGLRARGHDVRLLMRAEHPRARALAAEGLPVEPLVLRSRWDSAGVRTIRAHLARCPADVVHCLGGHKQIANARRAVADSRIALVGYRGTMGRLHRLDPFSWLSYLHPRIDRIVCASQAVERWLRGLGIPAARLCAIYKGHDPQWYRDVTAADLRGVGVPAGGRAVACAARFRPVKGLPTLLDAWPLLAADPGLHLLLIGELADPAAARRLRAGFPGSERVLCTGRRDDVLPLLAAAAAFVMPSREREGFPRAVIEAMGLGLPCVVSRVGGMAEQVEDGVTGRTVPPDDATALAAALRDVLTDPARARAMGAAGRQRLETRFTLERTVEETERLHRELVAERARLAG